VFPGADGAKRLLITASPAKVFQLFLAGSLKPLAAGVEGGSAFILDGTGHPLAAVGRETRPDPKVAAAAAKHTSGTVSARGEQFFAANPVPSSRWRVLVAAPTDKLYASASGTGRWLPWVILGICGLALLAIGLLLHRLLGATDTRVLAARRALGVGSAREPRRQLGGGNPGGVDGTGEHGVVGQRRDPPDPIEAEGAEHEPAELGARDPLPRRLREETHEHAGREGQGEGELELNRRRHCHP